MSQTTGAILNETGEPLNAKAREQFPPDPPAVLNQSFSHPIFLLIERFTQWQILLKLLHYYFESKKDTANALCNTYHDAAKSLEETRIKFSIINAMDSASSQQDSIFIRTMMKFRSFIESFMPLGKKFNHDYPREGGVLKNIEKMKGNVEQFALLEEKQRQRILDVTLASIKELQGSLSEGIERALSEWRTGHVEAENLANEAMSNYLGLVIASHSMDSESKTSPPLARDPLFCWLRYRSARDAYLSKVNNLQMAAILHQENAKKTEYELVDKLQNIINEYLTYTIEHNQKMKANFSQHIIPFDSDAEWKYFTNNNVTIPKEPTEPRQLLFLNHDHKRTKPIGEAELFLIPTFPWSIRSKRSMRRYVVTDGGYFMKALDVDKKEPKPTRAFFLKNCYVLEGPPKDELLSFTIRGTNIARTVTSMVMDRRLVWEFTGKEVEVRKLLKAIATIIPIIPYPIQRDFAIHGYS